MNANDWIKSLQSHPDWTTAEIDWKAVDEIEAKLKALDVVKRLPVEYLKSLLDFIKSFQNDRFCDFVGWGGDETPVLITEGEFKLLREALK